MRWTLADVAAALGSGAAAGGESLARLAGVSIDSRTLRPGELFIAIRGPRFDGHDFVEAAMRAGAAAALVERSRISSYPEEIRPKLLSTDDTLIALQQLARKYCDDWRCAAPGRRVAAVTGSAGKTTTKEILAALLAARLRVLKSEGNLNNEYGLPLTLFRLSDDHDAAVVEVGMSHRGELARLAQIAQPDVGVVTNVGPVHLEFFSSVDEIALAKRELIEGLGGENPVAVLNVDDARVSRFAEVARGRVLYFGASERAEFRAENIEERGVEGTVFDFEGPDELARLQLPLMGGHNVLNALAALAAASEWGIGAKEAREVFAKLKPGNMRGEILRFEAGFTIINDCYNSNPIALSRMVDVLCTVPGYKRRILVAGEWREIGPTSPELHREGGCQAAQKNCLDWIFSVVGDANEFLQGAMEAGFPAERTKFFETSDEAAQFLTGFVEKGDLLLVKGSRGVHMESIAAFLRQKFPLSGAAEKKLEGAAERRG